MTFKFGGILEISLNNHKMTDLNFPQIIGAFKRNLNIDRDDFSLIFSRLMHLSDKKIKFSFVGHSMNAYDFMRDVKFSGISVRIIDNAPTLKEIETFVNGGFKDPTKSPNLRSAPKTNVKKIHASKSNPLCMVCKTSIDPGFKQKEGKNICFDCWDDENNKDKNFLCIKASGKGDALTFYSKQLTESLEALRIPATKVDKIMNKLWRARSWERIYFKHNCKEEDIQEFRKRFDGLGIELRMVENVKG